MALACATNGGAHRRNERGGIFFRAKEQHTARIALRKEHRGPCGVFDIAIPRVADDAHDCDRRRVAADRRGERIVRAPQRARRCLIDDQRVPAARHLVVVEGAPPQDRRSQRGEVLRRRGQVSDVSWRMPIRRDGRTIAVHAERRTAPRCRDGHTGQRPELGEQLAPQGRIRVARRSRWVERRLHREQMLG